MDEAECLNAFAGLLALEIRPVKSLDSDRRGWLLRCLRVRKLTLFASGNRV